jgi:hypothetical protein
MSPAYGLSQKRKEDYSMRSAILVSGLSLLALFSAVGYSQDFELKFELDDVECGGAIFGVPGEPFRIEGAVVVDAAAAGALAWAISFGGIGPELQFDADLLDACDLACAEETTGLEINFNSPFAVDPELDPGDGPLAGAAQGPGVVDGITLQPPDSELGDGVTTLLRFAFNVTTTDSEEGEQVQLFFVDGLRGAGLPVVNGITNEFGATVDAEGGLAFSDCTVNLFPGGFRRGDSNDDALFDQSDPILTLNVLFLGEGELLCPDAADTNDDGDLDISDAVNSFTVLFLGGVEIPPPTGRCGQDPTDDDLGECEYNSC